MDEWPSPEFSGCQEEVIRLSFVCINYAYLSLFIDRISTSHLWQDIVSSTSMRKAFEDSIQFARCRFEFTHTAYSHVHMTLHFSSVFFCSHRCQIVGTSNGSTCADRCLSMTNETHLRLSPRALRIYQNHLFSRSTDIDIMI